MMQMSMPLDFKAKTSGVLFFSCVRVAQIESQIKCIEVINFAWKCEYYSVLDVWFGLPTIAHKKYSRDHQHCESLHAICVRWNQPKIIIRLQSFIYRNFYIIQLYECSYISLYYSLFRCWLSSEWNLHSKYIFYLKKLNCCLFVKNVLHMQHRKTQNYTEKKQQHFTNICFFWLCFFGELRGNGNIPVCVRYVILSGFILHLNHLSLTRSLST